jgi:periplasmic divalent cation tolerance protein
MAMAEPAAGRNQFLQVTTTNTEAEARHIANKLVEQRLAACVQVVGPIESTYWWQGNIEVATEWQCLIKTHSRSYPLLEQELRAMHSYETPEIVAVHIVEGNSDYLAWLGEQLVR